MVVCRCIDPTKRGDVSSELAVDANGNGIPHRRLQAVDSKKGEKAIPNPNSAAVWHYIGVPGAFDDTMHRTSGTVAIKNNLLFIADFSGLLHCLNAKTGVAYWTYDMLAQSWGSPLIVDGKVYIGDEDGDITVFGLDAHPFIAMPNGVPIAEINMQGSVYTTPIVAGDVLFIATDSKLFAIK